MKHYYEPIIFGGYNQETVWGGNNLKKLFPDLNLPTRKIGEVWTVSGYPKRESISKQGAFEGETLLSIFNYASKREAIFGSKCAKMSEFPLLVKWLDANERLSVQVHPNDKYARSHESSLGKTEAWYVVSAKPKAKIVYGLKAGTTKLDLKSAIREGNIEDVLNFIPVKAGDFFYIPSGTVHALLEGVVVYEVQQSSDITYRLYDWNRQNKNGKTRELHIKQALDVISFKDNGINQKSEDNEGNNLISSEYFTLNKITFDGAFVPKKRKDTFTLYTVVEGYVFIRTERKIYCEIICAGQSFLIPADSGIEISIIGKATIMEAYL